MIRQYLISIALVTGAVLAAPPGVAQPSVEKDLSLYGVTLKEASVATFTAAAQKAGARSVGSKEGLPSFDAKATGVPALESFELLADGDKVVTVQFVVGYPTETLRKMLIAKYGPPRQESADPFGRHSSFDAEYLSDGKFAWHFPGGMKLIWNQPFIGTTTLSYTDEPKFNAMMVRAKQSADKNAVNKAAAASSSF
jgi:hypothetical protein